MLHLQFSGEKSMRYVVLAAGAALLSTVAANAADIETACLAVGDRTQTECSCFEDVARTSLTENDQAYVVVMMPGPAATRAALRDMAGDVNEFMQRYVAFSAAVEAQCQS